MDTIYKYNLEITDRQIIRIVKYFEPLCIKNQNGNAVLYCQIDADSDLYTDEEIFCFGTGHDIKNEQLLKYIDTVIIDKFVWHFFIKQF